MKPYQEVPIVECGEAIVPIPAKRFSLISPHPYENVGAPYGKKSPFFVRQGVLERLDRAQTLLQQTHPGWTIQIFDAYRPIAVQQYMVEYAFQELVQQRGLVVEQLTEAERQSLMELVYEFWAVPNPDPALPPPHSTGAAVDVTLVDDSGRVVDMGSPIDELSPRSYPNHFAHSTDQHEQAYHALRQVLDRVMSKAGFWRHPREWWHFSFGDQLWAWLQMQDRPEQTVVAHYGRAWEEL